MKAPPFLIQADASGETLQPIEDRERVYDEYWLQELLRKHPDILPVAEIEPVFSPLVPIGRNPDAKREVVAQAIDYASSVSKWNYSKLDEVAREYTKKYENAEIGLVDLVEGLCGPVEGGHYFFEETAAKNLRLGRFLTLIVGDRIKTLRGRDVGLRQQVPPLGHGRGPGRAYLLSLDFGGRLAFAGRTQPGGSY
jgi:hypothetical protein